MDPLDRQAVSDRPILYFAITAHGYGHATRAAAIAAEVQRRCPEVLLVMVTQAPRWLLASYIPGEFIYRPRSLDVGAIQGDSLTMDLPGTLEAWRSLRSRLDSLVAAEADFIRQMSAKNGRVALVLADLPPTAMAIAAAAEVPCWGMGNFGWDFIYRPWGGEFEALADWVAAQFSQCDRLFRLPFSEPMAAFPNQESVGLTGGTPRYGVEELRDRLKLPPVPKERTVLLTFGGLGVDAVPYDAIDAYPDWLFLTFNRHAPAKPNLYVLQDPQDHEVGDRPWRPVDLMPLCDRVVSKPGYSTYSEACRLGLAIATLPRDGFAEAPVLLDGLRRFAPHQLLDAETFFRGDWSFLKEPPNPPMSSDRLATDGTDAIAAAVIEALN